MAEREREVGAKCECECEFWVDIVTLVLRVDAERVSLARQLVQAANQASVSGKVRGALVMTEPVSV